MAPEQQRTISNGPSKFDLMVSLFEGNKTPRHTVTFTFDEGGEIDVAITMIAQEDGSGESWIFEGYSTNPGYRIGQIHGYYSSRSRTGWWRMGRKARG